MSKNFLGNLLILLACGLGLLTGFFNVNFLNQAADATSETFLKLLKLISLPIIFLSICSTISGMRDFQEMRKLGRKVITYTIGTTILAASVALILFQIIQPAKEAMQLSSLTSDVAATSQQASYWSFVLNIVPSNLVQAFIDNNVIGIAFVAILFSFAVLLLPQSQKVFLHQLFSSLFAATLKVTGFVIQLMPIAIWAFTTLLAKDLSQNYSHINSLLLYLACVVGANLLQGLIVLPLLLKFKKISPWRSFKGMSPALTLAFFSKSSNATLPVTLRSAEQNLGVSKKISSFTLPLCSVINMNGCAAFILITVLFVSMVNGITFSSFDLVIWVFLATIAAIGNAGVPMGCFFLTSAFLIGMHVPIYMMGIILPFYTILDMIETTLNVWSDACITIIVDKDLALAGELPALNEPVGIPDNSKISTISTTH